MSRYRGARLRIIRRLGKLPGLTSKIPSKQKKNPPGQHGQAKRKFSQYNLQLREKQKLRYNYGITERQLVNYVKKSRKGKGSSGKILLSLLEMRLDNIVFRLGFAPSIVSARQLINHGHIAVDGNIVNIPSYQCKPKNNIESKKAQASEKIIRQNLVNLNDQKVPEFLNVDRKNLRGEVISLIPRNNVLLVVNELLVIEYYSRKV